MKDIIPNQQVLTAVTEVGNGFKARIKEQLVNRFNGRVAAWQLKCQETPGKTSPNTFWPHTANSAYFSNQTIRQDIFPLLDSVARPVSEWINEPRPHEQNHFSLKADYQAIIERKAESMAAEAVAGFIAKMSAKLQGILDSKGDFTQVNVRGTLGQNYMRFEFADGSAFSVTNDIVLGFSCKGRPYNQYPTRFTAVILRNQQVKNACSEAAVKKLFVKEAA